jgi:hypothetical protein
VIGPRNGPYVIEPIIVDISVREFLQRYGTEAHREIFGEDVWVDMLCRQIHQQKKYVITDCRFPNECRAIKDKGGSIVVIERPGTDVEDAHASEADIPPDLVDAVIVNDGTKSDLYRALSAYLSQ